MNNPQQNDAWSDCPTGQIAKIVQYSKSRERHLIVRRVSLCVSTFCVLLFAGYLVVGHPFAGRLLGGIYCQDVIINSDSYLSGEIDAELARKIKNHLALCDTCRTKIEQKKNRRADESSQLFQQDRSTILSSLTLNRKNRKP